MSKNVIVLTAIVCFQVCSSGCAPIYGNMVSKNQLGAAEYLPAVFVPPEKQAQYEQILAICRQAAANRQITAAQQAQLKTITGATQDVTDTALLGAGLGQVFDGNALKGAGIGAAAGLISSLAGSFSSGTESSAAKTREALLNCLRTQEGPMGIRVLE